MKKVKWIIIILVFAGMGFGIYKIYDYFQKEKNAWKIEIINDYVNIRSKPSIYEGLIKKARKGDVFKVLEINLDDGKYVWYKVNLGSGSSGWISSDRDNPYVKEINNPNEKEGGNDYFIDYKNPILRFYQEEYHVLDMGSINYNHLFIKDDSEYTVSHEVYYEEHPKDQDEPQYWIKYIVVDKFGNRTSKMQKIIFEQEPNSSDVKKFEELNR